MAAANGGIALPFSSLRLVAAVAELKLLAVTHAVIRTFHSSADDRDFRAMTRGRGSFGRNLLLASVPVALFLSALVFFVWRSLIAASIVGVLAFVGSAWSNFRFFSDVRRRQESRADSEAVEVSEVLASRVFDIEPLGSHGPAFVFFADGGKAMLLVGQWLLRYRSFHPHPFACISGRTRGSRFALNQPADESNRSIRQFSCGRIIV